MTRTARLLAAAGLAGSLALGLAGPAGAETYAGNPHQADRTLVVHVDQGLRAFPAEVRQINDALLEWNRQAAGNRRLPRIVEARWTSTNCRSRPALGTVEVCGRRWGPPPARVGYASPGPRIGAHWAAGAFVVINLDQLGRCHSAGYVMAHELGHVLGLDHNDDPASVMSYACQSPTFTAEDLADLGRLYH